MIVNIKSLDDVLRATIVAEFDQRSINDEVPAFHDRAPTAENVLGYIVERLSQPDALPAGCRLAAVRLEEMPTLWAEWRVDGQNKSVTLTRTYEFAASHRLHAPGLSAEENVELFGKCNNPAGHGHNYVLEVTVSGEPSAERGMIVDRDALDAAVDREVVNRYDHKNLSEDIPEFQGRPTTTEVVTEEIFRRLAGTVPARLAKVKLWETARNAFEVGA
jgi:6-pyruvoyltetrahydropterin/6-carboxytetrahydropterin synthase